MVMDENAARPVLRKLRLGLAPCRPDDREDFIALERDPEVMRFLNGGHAVDNEEGDPDSPFLMPRGTEDHVWTARRTGSGAFVGWFCLWPMEGRVAELGYRLRLAEWGQGLATEGASALIGWGFASARYDRIVANAMAVNHASRRVMEKLGLRYRRSIPIEGAQALPDSEAGDVE